MVPIASSVAVLCPHGTGNWIREVPVMICHGLCPQVNRVVCLPCPIGSYTDDVGRSSCTLCLAGKNQSSTGSTSCSACVLGTYQDKTGRPDCKMYAPC